MFHLFGGSECYYASGGANDFIKSFADQTSAADYARLKESAGKIDWWHVTDSALNIVATSDVTPYLAESGASTEKWD